MNSDFIKKLDQIRQQLPAIFKRLPGIAKVEGLRFIADNFEHEGFEEKKGSYKAWPKKKTKGATKKTLVGEKRGASLKRSWQQDSTAGADYTAFQSQLPYAGVHNDGLKAGRPPGFMMPERKMIGDSEALFGRIEGKMDRMMDEAIK
jgi:phage gpG-like protein